tara:strand:- start:1964 stop:2290 length:327 start_codon:yes stop_codon:yes gene_type:complete
MQEAKDKLQSLLVWESNPITITLLRDCEAQAHDNLLGVTRIPADTWDEKAREQDMGFIKGLLEFRGLIKVYRANLEHEAEGLFDGEASPSELDLNEALQYPGDLGQPM